MKYRIIAAGVLAASLLSYSSSSFAQIKTFPDVENHWSKESVNYLVGKGAIAGNPDGTFTPDREVTRGEAATMMAKILNLKIEDGAKPTYKDAQNHWATKYIAAVEKVGVIKGKGDGTFDPDGKIDRASIASMLVGAYKFDTKVSGTVETKFADLNDHWGKEKANILVALGISKGTTSTTWEPTKTVTRAEAAQFIAKADSFQVQDPLEGKVIIIDPGHGGKDPGKDTQGLSESNIVLDTSKRLQQLLEKNTPFNALLTRETDIRLGDDQKSDLENRVKFAKEHDGDIFVSIHANASQEHNGYGTETFYYKESKTGELTEREKESRMLAEKIQKRLVEALHTRDRKVQEKDLYVTRENEMPAVLTELAFLDNSADYEKLATESGRQVAAEAIYAGILDYYEWKNYDVSKYRLAK